ncbi:MAG: hypothetical protein H6738_06195 [Alphaproteobacteria bacterium]|nr:hypothetical protein [Alphaproteobacteria bacterium]MCB9696353.1 hypothetical protein [Alphaproteobacteria bacterium]
MRLRVLLSLLCLSPCVMPRPSARPARATPLPANTFAGLCEARCDPVTWGQRPTVPASTTCPGGYCTHDLEVAFDDHLRVELDGQLSTTSPARLTAWTGPVVVQVHATTGEVWRCSLDLDADRRLTARRAWLEDDSLRVWLSEGATEHACERVRPVDRWSVGGVADIDDAELQRWLAVAEEALSAARFRDDEAVSRWLVGQGHVEGGSLVRGGGRAVVVDAWLATVRRPGSEQCAECSFAAAFEGELAGRVTITFEGTTRERFCAMWDAHDAVAIRQTGALDSVVPTDGPCPGSIRHAFTVPRVPFDRPVKLDPTPRALRPEPGVPRASVVGLPDEVQRDIEGLGATIARLEPERTDRLLAVHDWIATHIRYDVAALRGPRPPQDAASVLQRGTAVCAGYANLAVALGRAAGLDVVYVDGVTQDEGHAWNAADVGGRWALFDVTWDAGVVAGDTFVPGYSDDWFDPPPERFRATHHPTDPSWQLVLPESDAAFMARPRLGGGVVLLDPVERRASEVRLRLDGPDDLRVRWRRAGRETLEPCALERGVASCGVPDRVRAVVEIDADGAFAGQLELAP